MASLSEPKYEHIMSIYSLNGGNMTVARLTRLCHEAGVWDEEEWNQMAYKGAKVQVHRALKAKDGTGLPRAGVSPHRVGHAHVWIQLEFWDYDTALYNLDMLCTQVEKDYHQIQLLKDYIEKRWGTCPATPVLTYDEEASFEWRYSSRTGEPLPLDDEDDDD
jgi:hypothetical protein